jgi:fibronectin-binding autotransporter adhesin
MFLTRFMKTHILALLLALPFSSLAATRVWTNSSVDSLWSTAANWSNGIPVNGDSVVLLRHPLGLGVNAMNDLTNLSLQSIRCDGGGHNINGGTLRLSGDLIAGGPIVGASLTINAPLEILGPSSQFLSTNGGAITLAGVVNAPAGSVLTVEGGMSFRALVSSDYRAETRLQSGFMALIFTRVRGPLVIGGTSNSATVVLQSGNLFAECPPITVLTNGTLFNISTFNSVGPFTVNGGVVRLGNRSPNGEITVNGNALLTGGGSVFISAINDFGPGELSVTGTVTLAGCSLAFQPGSSTVTKPAIIVRNDGNDPVSGTFTGLPEGGELTNNTVRYVVSYVGGDGNDITITPIVEAARFIVSGITNGTPQFTVQGQPGFIYVVEATTNLLSPAALIPWVAIRTNGTIISSQFSFSDTESTNFPRRFFRARTQ